MKEKIAKLCPSEGGMATYVAQGLLGSKNLEDIQREIDLCTEKINFDSVARSRAKGNIRQDVVDIKKAISFYPNPVKNELVFINRTILEVKIEIIDITGKVVQTEKLLNGESQKTLNLGKGIYIVKAIFKNGEVSTEKLIVN